MALTDIETDDFSLDDLVSELSKDVKDALDFMDTAFGSDRERAEKYYAGGSDVPVDGNRSKYVATKVRDTVRGVRPSLLRVFLSSVAPVEFLPSSRVSASLARQQTAYVVQKFHEAGGYMAIYEAFQNAMLHKVGPVQYWWEDEVQEDFRTYTNLSAEQFQVLQQTPDIRVVSAETETITAIGPNGEPIEEPVYTVELAYQTHCGKLRIEPVLLNEFVIDDGAINGRPPRVIGRQLAMPISDILQTYPDIDPEQLHEIADGEEPELKRNLGESERRRGYMRRKPRRNPQDPSMRRVVITDVYWRADLDGTGIAQTWRWVLGGVNQKELLHYERAEDGHNFALFQIDPKPGAVFGDSLYDLTHNDQDGLTSLTRGVIDNAHASNNPRIAYHETMVNADDILNWDIGSPIRFRAAGMIQPVEVPFIGGALQPFIEYWNHDVENKTGVSRASLGLDPRAMQSTDKEAVQNTIRNAAGQVEVMARNLGETGMVPLFRGLLRLCLRHQHPSQVMWVTGEAYVPVDLRYFDPTLNMQVNVGLGGGDDDKRVLGLEKVMGVQEKILGQFGPQQPVVQPHQVTAAIEDYVKALGFKDATRYVTPLTPDQSEQLMQQMAEAANQPPPPDPTLQALKETEMIKSQSRMAEKTMESDLKVREKMVDVELDIATQAREDDLERDRMLQDLYIAAGKLMIEGGNLDVKRIQLMQAATQGAATARQGDEKLGIERQKVAQGAPQAAGRKPNGAL